METPTHHRRLPIRAFLAVALLSVALPAALQAQEAVAAQQPAAAPAATPQAVRQIPEEKLTQYVAAYIEIADVRERINAEFARMGNKIPEAQQELQKQRLEEVTQIIEAKGLTRDEYEQITWVLSVDSKQMETFQQILAQQEGGTQQQQ